MPSTIEKSSFYIYIVVSKLLNYIHVHPIEFEDTNSGTTCINGATNKRETVRKEESLTRKNFSQNFSKGNEPGVRNMKAIFGVFDSTGGVFKISLKATLAAISSSVNSRDGT